MPRAEVLSSSEQLGLFLPTHTHFPFNHPSGLRVRDVLLPDLERSEDVLLITGYSSLERLVVFLAGRQRASAAWTRIRLVLGTEPMRPTRERSWSAGAAGMAAEIRDYWLAQSVSPSLCAQVIRALQVLEDPRVEVRRSGEERIHAKLYVTQDAVTLGSSNFSRPGLDHQVEANIRIPASEHERNAEARSLAEMIWEGGVDYREGLIALLRELLSAVRWEEALARASAALLDDEAADIGASEAATLWPSQHQGIAQALWVLRNAGSVLVADATGAGKTRMGAQLLRAATVLRARTGRADRIFTVMVCPPKVRTAWEREATDCSLALNPVSQGVVSTANAEANAVARNAIRRADILAVDEAHNFLNRGSVRTQALYANTADHVVLFTATPINRGTHDLLAIVDMLGADHFDDAVLDIVNSLWDRGRRSGEGATAEELSTLRRAIAQFTVRRTKRQLNTLVDEAPDAYVNGEGQRCRYPEHAADSYPGGETEHDREVARAIAEETRRLLGVARLQSLRMPAELRKRRLSPAQYAEMRRRSAPLLAAYQVRESLRSSRAALVEHLSGTAEALDFAGVASRAKRQDSGNMIATLHRIEGRVPSSDLPGLPTWLLDADAHREACRADAACYQRIRGLVGEMSDGRENRKAEVLTRLLRSESLVLAFDRHVITLLDLERRLANGARVLVATGGNPAATRALKHAFRLGSEERNLVALCSDAMSEGINLQAASALVLLDLPSVIRLIEQRIGRIDRMDSPHRRVVVLWPDDSPEFALSSDELLARRHQSVEELLGANIELPADLAGAPGDSPLPLAAVQQIVHEHHDARERELALLGDAFSPVRSLVEGDHALISPILMRRMQGSTARVLASVSVVAAERPWTFFAVGAADRLTPRWVFVDLAAARPETDLAAIAEALRARLHPETRSLAPNEAAGEQIRQALAWIAQHERLLLSRKRQRALDEMERTLRAYLNRARDGGAEPDAERAAVSAALLARLRPAPDPEAEVAPAWQRMADWWLHVIRPAWQEHLGDKARTRFARLRDLRRTLQHSPISTKTLQTGLAEIWEQPDLGRRVVAAIVGVPADVAGEASSL